MKIEIILQPNQIKRQLVVGYVACMRHPLLISGEWRRFRVLLHSDKLTASQYLQAPERC